MCYRFDTLNWGYYISILNHYNNFLLFRKYSNNKSLNADKQGKDHPRYWERHLQQKWLPGQSAALIHITTRTTQNQLVQSWNSWQTVKIHFCLLWLFTHVLFLIRMTLALNTSLTGSNYYYPALSNYTSCTLIHSPVSL